MNNTREFTLDGFESLTSHLGKDKLDRQIIIGQALLAIKSVFREHGHPSIQSLEELFDHYKPYGFKYHMASKYCRVAMFPEDARMVVNNIQSYDLNKVCVHLPQFNH